MNLFAGLKDDEIDALLYYVDNSSHLLLLLLLQKFLQVMGKLVVSVKSF